MVSNREEDVSRLSILSLSSTHLVLALRSRASSQLQVVQESALVAQKMHELVQTHHRVHCLSKLAKLASSQTVPQFQSGAKN